MECMDLSSCKQQVLFTTSSSERSQSSCDFCDALSWIFCAPCSKSGKWRYLIKDSLPKNVILVVHKTCNHPCGDDPHPGSIPGLDQSFEGAGWFGGSNRFKSKESVPKIRKSSQSPKLTYPNQIKWFPSFETQHAAFACFTKIGGWKCLGRRISTFHYHQWTKGRRVAKRPTTCEEITWIISASPMTF